MDRASLSGKMEENTKVHGSVESKVELVFTETQVVFDARARGWMANVKNGSKAVQSDKMYVSQF